MLKITNLNKSFGGLKAVDQVNLNIDRIGITAIIGPNGAGKTTLFNIITGCLNPSSGSIVFENNNISNLSTNAIAKLGISRTLQVKSVFANLTVEENLSTALQRKLGFFKIKNNKRDIALIKSEVLRISTMLKINDKLNLVSSSLSYGDICLLEIAIAIISKPKLLMLDEPLCGMGPSETTETIKIIKNLSQEVKILIIEHDMEAVFALADNIIVMANGSILVEGKPEEIKKNPKVISTYLGEEE
jgi:branched-chain amino acid transport system ATP-binding protein